MVFTEILPQKSLTPFVESYSLVHEKRRITIYPEGIFYLLFSPSRDSRNQKHAFKVSIIPLSDAVQHIDLTEGSILVRCKAFVLFKKEQFNCKEVRQLFSSGRMVEMEAPQGSDLVNHLAQDILSENFKIDWNLRDYVNYILVRRGHVSIEEMSKSFGISRQSIHRKFKYTLSIGPKKLAFIWKLNSFIYNFQNGCSAVEAAIDAGYYDQAHLINDFKKVYGKPPNEFLNQNSEFYYHSIQNRFNSVYAPQF